MSGNATSQEFAHNCDKTFIESRQMNRWAFEAMFDIHLTGEIVTEEDDPDFKALWGEIRIGAFRERFVARVVSWSAEQYEKQWESALRKIVTGSTTTALITDYVEPNLSSGNSLWWWPLYREGVSVYIQNQLRMLYRKGDSVYMQDQLASSGPLDLQFSLQRPWESIKERTIVGAEGSKISEWATTVESIEDCLVRRFKQS
jgi:hypothetical protein